MATPSGNFHRLVNLISPYFPSQEAARQAMASYEVSNGQQSLAFKQAIDTGNITALLDELSATQGKPLENLKIADTYKYGVGAFQEGLIRAFNNATGYVDGRAPVTFTDEPTFPVANGLEVLQYRPLGTETRPQYADHIRIS